MMLRRTTKARRHEGSLKLVLRVFVPSWFVVAAFSGAPFAQRASGGLPPCPAGTMKRLGGDEARQCWLKAAHGGWRILERDGHYDTAVYHVGADDLQDAHQIAAAIVAGDGETLGELLLYVYLEPVAK